MNRIGLKINGIWCVLPQDISISIEEQNPLFSDSGSFSYPIEMDIDQNRELFKSIDSPHGRIRPQDLDGLPFELWYDGVLLLYGSTETDEDLDIDEGKCSINLVSGNGDFQSKIEGMQCTDVDLLEKIKIGHSYPEIEISYIDIKGDVITERKALQEDNTMYYESVNISDPYPIKPFCNVRVCVGKKESYKPGEEEPYWVLEANRPFSGVCFYVGYFLDCLFSKLGVTIKENHFGDVGDMNRLAFFTTKCAIEYGDEEVYIEREFSNGGGNLEVKEDYVHFTIYRSGSAAYSWGGKVFRRDVYATKNNFPDVPVKDVVDSLFNAFGLKIMSDPTNNTIRIVYLRDVLRDNEIIDTTLKVTNKVVSYNKLKGVTMTYDGDEDDTSFVYKDWSNIETFTDYKQVLQSIDPYNKKCYVSKITGNKYRVKIDGDAEEEGDVEHLYPTLFEVAQFNNYTIGEESEDNEEISIAFTPVIENAVSGEKAESLIDMDTQRLAIYIPDAEMNKPSYELGKNIPLTNVNKSTREGMVVYLRIAKYINYDSLSTDESPLQKHDSGFTLGIMRGAGSESSTEVVIENYDGNGNDAWTTVVADYAFTADTMDAYGNRYDYNGTAEGGIADQENSISLKTHIQTAKDVGLKNEDGTDVDWGIDASAAKRGLADRFMSEYMYWLLHRKTVSMDVDTTLSQLTSLNWLKQHRILDTTGFLKSRSYTLSNSGVTNMGIEIYTIN